MLLVCASCVALSACSAQEIAELNRQISDGAFAVTKVLNVSVNQADDDLKYLSQAPRAKREKRDHVIEVPVDVDTAAGRLKRYYKFYSNEEVDAIRNNGHMWDAMPGSYYKMGSDWDGGEFDDHLTLELEKNGKGSRIYITYASPAPGHLKDKFIEPLVKRVKDVAEGRVR
ncbi:TPA: hypothetical protein PPH20_004959 [Escherichia coli]|nr:hypothetical protein [Escherichia coli]HDI9912950.1 hypothetical protein [Escherichia coli]